MLALARTSACRGGTLAHRTCGRRGRTTEPPAEQRWSWTGSALVVMALRPGTRAARDLPLADGVEDMRRRRSSGSAAAVRLRRRWKSTLRQEPRWRNPVRRRHVRVGAAAAASAYALVKHASAFAEDRLQVARGLAGPRRTAVAAIQRRSQRASGFSPGRSRSSRPC